MNWNINTFGDSPTRAFEMLCNQLFENWCKEEYKSRIKSFNVVNGDGGDGGVESYAILDNGEIIGLQAKWFLTSISSSQIGQIKNSLKTAMKIRPEISRYIVCIPRDLTSITAKGKNSESARWESLKNSMENCFPNLTIELWNETKLVSELQKESSEGLYRFWFEKAEISEETIMFSLKKGKESWLSEKYVPELELV